MKEDEILTFYILEYNRSWKQKLADLSMLPEPTVNYLPLLRGRPTQNVLIESYLEVTEAWDNYGQIR